MAEVEQAKTLISENGQGIPGRFDCPYERYKGYLAFPSPLTYSHFKEWWKVSVAPLKDLAVLDFDHWDCLFKGAQLLIGEYGEWEIEGPNGKIPIGDLKAGNVPLELAEWACVCSRAYIYPMLDPKKSHMLRTLF